MFIWHSLMTSIFLFLQRREFPDGIVKTIYPDGRHETWFPNGRVRMRDKDGNVVMDQIVYR